MNREQILSALTAKVECGRCHGRRVDPTTLGMHGGKVGNVPCIGCAGTGLDPLLIAMQAVGWMLMRQPGLDQTWAGDDGVTGAEQAAKALQEASAPADPEVCVRVDAHRLVVWTPRHIPMPSSFAGLPVTVVHLKPAAGRVVEPLESGTPMLCLICHMAAVVCCHCPDCAVAPQTDRYAACSGHMFEARKAHDKVRDHMVVWGPVGGPRRAP